MGTTQDRARYIEQAPYVAEQLSIPHRVKGFVRQTEAPDLYPAGIPGSEPMQFHVDGTPQDTEFTDGIANNVLKGHYSKLKAGLIAHQDTAETIDKIINQLDSGGNVTVVTPHADLMDIAFAVKIAGDLVNQGKSEADSAIVISKMVPTLGYKLEGGIVPAMWVLEQLCKDIYLTWPKTDSSRSVINDLPPGEVARHNTATKAAIKERLERGKRLQERGVLFAMAPTGTTRVKRDETTGEHQLAKITKGTDEILRLGGLVLPMTIQFAGEDSHATMPHGLIEPGSSDEIQDLLADLYPS